MIPSCQPTSSPSVIPTSIPTISRQIQVCILFQFEVSAVWNATNYPEVRDAIYAAVFRTGGYSSDIVNIARPNETQMCGVDLGEFYADQSSRSSSSKSSKSHSQYRLEEAQELALSLAEADLKIIAKTARSVGERTTNSRRRRSSSSSSGSMYEAAVVEPVSSYVPVVISISIRAYVPGEITDPDNFLIDQKEEEVFDILNISLYKLDPHPNNPFPQWQFNLWSTVYIYNAWKLFEQIDILSSDFRSGVNLVIGNPYLVQAPTSRPTTSAPTSYPSLAPVTSRPTRPGETNLPTSVPTTSTPSSQPSSQPSMQPFSPPTSQPSTCPTNPSSMPTGAPTTYGIVPEKPSESYTVAMMVGIMAAIFCCCVVACVCYGKCVSSRKSKKKVYVLDTDTAGEHDGSSAAAGVGSSGSPSPSKKKQKKKKKESKKFSHGGDDFELFDVYVGDDANTHLGDDAQLSFSPTNSRLERGESKFDFDGGTQQSPPVHHVTRAAGDTADLIDNTSTGKANMDVVKFKPKQLHFGGDEEKDSVPDMPAAASTPAVLSTFKAGSGGREGSSATALLAGLAVAKMQNTTATEKNPQSAMNAGPGGKKVLPPPAVLPPSIPAAVRRKMNNGLIFVKPQCAMMNVNYLISSKFDALKIRVVSVGKYSGIDLEKFSVFDRQFAYIDRYASKMEPDHVRLTSSENAAFNQFVGDHRSGDVSKWSDLCENQQIFNAVEACKALGVGIQELYVLWCGALAQKGPESLVIQLRKGLSVAKLDESCTEDPNLKSKLEAVPVYVMNGFYPTMRAQYFSPTVVVKYMVIEWDALEHNWEQFQTEVIGDSDPAKASPTSIRGAIYSDWKALGLEEQPTRRDNCVHFSASAFEAMAERLVWLKGNVLFTDTLGTRMIADHVPSQTVQAWLLNPMVHDKYVFDHMLGLDPEQTIAKAHELISPKVKLGGAAAAVLAASKSHWSPPKKAAEKHDMTAISSARPDAMAPLKPEALPKAIAQPLRASMGLIPKHLKENCVLFVKTGANTPEIYGRIDEILSVHRVKIVNQGFIRGSEMYSRKIMELQFADVFKLAEIVKPTEVPITSEEKFEFNKTYSITWDAVKGRNMYNAKDACKYLEVSVDALNTLCNHSSAEACRLRRGFHITRLSKQCTDDVTLKNKLIVPIFIINGFYGSLRDKYYNKSTTTRFLVLEWDSDLLSWAKFSSDVIGDADPDMAYNTSLRGSLIEDWDTMGLTEAPSRINNVVHVSHSSFEGLAEKIIWMKGLTAFTDPFGAKLLEKSNAATITSWLLNPLVEDMYVFDHMSGLSSEQCLVKVEELMRSLAKRTIKSPEKELQHHLSQKEATSYNKSKKFFILLSYFLMQFLCSRSLFYANLSLSLLTISLRLLFILHKKNRCG